MINTAPASQLRLERVSLAASLGSQFLLHEISFDVMAGDRIAIVGPSGAGKTSLLRLLNRLNEPTAGQIFWAGRQMGQVPVLQLRQQIVLVGQESKLLGMTVRQALEYPLLLRKLPSQTIQQRLLTWTEKMHIPQEWLERTEVQLSLGQRQWVAVVRALMIQPQILLLDEPTSALDAGRSSYLIDTLIELEQAQQTTILMVNHQLELAQQFSSRLLHLQQGKLVQDSPTQQVDWTKLKQSLIDAETQIAEDWE
jgi:D-methionine transport system ATP-binding protein